MINGPAVPALEHRIFGVSPPNQQVNTTTRDFASPLDQRHLANRAKPATQK
jgi:hypothetical protein